MRTKILILLLALASQASTYANHIGCAADVNQDGTVDSADTLEIKSHIYYGRSFARPGADGYWFTPDCDVDGNGKVDWYDMYQAINDFGVCEIVSVLQLSATTPAERWTTAVNYSISWQNNLGPNELVMYQWQESKTPNFSIISKSRYTFGHSASISKGRSEYGTFYYRVRDVSNGAPDWSDPVTVHVSYPQPVATANSAEYDAMTVLINRYRYYRDLYPTTHANWNYYDYWMRAYITKRNAL